MKESGTFEHGSLDLSEARPAFLTASPTVSRCRLRLWGRRGRPDQRETAAADTSAACRHPEKGALVAARTCKKKAPAAERESSETTVSRLAPPPAGETSLFHGATGHSGSSSREDERPRTPGADGGSEVRKPCGH